eukprot:Em0003g727a
MIFHFEKTFAAKHRGLQDRQRDVCRRDSSHLVDVNAYQTELQTAKRKKEEGWAADLADRLRIMAQKGYPDLEDKAKEQLALNVFLSLIDNSQVAFAVRQRRPATLDTAVSATLEIECYADSKSHVVGGGVTNDQLIGGAGTSPVTADVVKKLTERMERLEARLEGERERTGDEHSGSVREKRQSFDGVSLPTEESFFLYGNVKGVGLKLLVDTEPRPSLLDSKIWSKINEGMLEKWEGPRLVGVDGSPLKDNSCHNRYPKEEADLSGVAQCFLCARKRPPLMMSDWLRPPLFPQVVVIARAILETCTSIPVRVLNASDQSITFRQGTTIGQKLGQTSKVQHAIHTSSSLPIRQHPRRNTTSSENSCQGTHQEMMDNDIIQPSKSGWASPIVLAKKKDGSDGIEADPDKLRKVQCWPTPQNVREVQQFLGLANYSRRFIRNFAEVARPLHRLTERSASVFQWTIPCQESFNLLRELLSSPPILSYPDFKKPFIWTQMPAMKELVQYCHSWITTGGSCNTRSPTKELEGKSVEIRRLWQLWDQLVLKEGVLYRKFADCNEESAAVHQLVVPPALRNEVLREVHEGTFGGHLGEEKTFKKLRAAYYWPGYYNATKLWCTTCVVVPSAKQQPLTTGLLSKVLHTNWDEDLSKVCMAYNTSIQSTTGYTPFFLMFGREARLPLAIVHEPPPSLMETIPQQWCGVNMSTRQGRQKEFYNCKVHGDPFKPGDPGNNKSTVVHFDRLKRCPSGMRLQEQTSTARAPPGAPNAPSGTHVEPTEVDDEDVESPALIDDEVPAHDEDHAPEEGHTPDEDPAHDEDMDPTSRSDDAEGDTRRYPTRTRRPPDRLQLD